MCPWHRTHSQASIALRGNVGSSSCKQGVAQGLRCIACYLVKRILGNRGPLRRILFGIGVIILLTTARQGRSFAIILKTNTKESWIKLKLAPAFNPAVKAVGGKGPVRASERNRANFSSCNTDPGQAENAEGSAMGYNNLLRIREIKMNESSAKGQRLLCVFPSFPSVQLQNAAVETYGKNCDGRLVVSRNTPLVSYSSQTYWINERDPTYRDGAGAILQQILHKVGNEYDWFYFAQPGRYLIGSNAQIRLSFTRNGTDLARKNPLALRTYIHNLWEFPKKVHARGSCPGTEFLNRAAVDELVHVYLKNKESTSGDSNLITWIQSVISDTGTRCVKGLLAKMPNPQKYAELLLSPNATFEQQAVGLYRIQSILNGTCDRQWREKFGFLNGDVRDVTLLRKHGPAFDFFPAGFHKSVCETPFGTGTEGHMGYRGLRKIQIAQQSQEKRILCMIYTHESRHEQLRSIVETWGKGCDGFFAASTKNDESLGAINLLHEGPELYDNLWMKVRAMWQYAFDHFLNDYDFFHIGGDDHYVIVENLKYTVATGNWKEHWNQSVPLFLGGSVADHADLQRRYCGGGSGYTLNRIALRRLVEELFPKSQCWPHWTSAQEDRIMAGCFRSVGIQCMDTNDYKNETRYHPWGVDYHASWTKRKKGNWHPKVLETVHGIAQPEGLAQISDSSVSFHLKPLRTDPDLPPDRGMRRYHAILYGLCENILRR